MAKVCIDTQLLIAGFLPSEHVNSDPKLITVASELMEDIAKENSNVLIPTIVIGEILAGIPASEHNTTIAQLRRLGPSVTYTIRSAKSFARMYSHQDRKTVFEAIRTKTDISKESLKVDLMIAATAESHKATILYTYDDKFEKLMQLLKSSSDEMQSSLSVIDLKKQPRQLRLEL